MGVNVLEGIYALLSHGYFHSNYGINIYISREIFAHPIMHKSQESLSFRGHQKLTSAFKLRTKK